MRMMCFLNLCCVWGGQKDVYFFEQGTLSLSRYLSVSLSISLFLSLYLSLSLSLSHCRLWDVRFCFFFIPLEPRVDGYKSL